MNFSSFLKHVATIMLLCVAVLLLRDCNGVQAFAYKTDPTASSCHDILDVPKLKERLQSGRAYQHFDFLSEEEVNVLWEEIHRLEEKGDFAISGLSNTAQGDNQDFGSKDRALCPAPWWTDSLEGKGASSPDIQPFASRIQDLRLALASLLNRPTMTNPSLAHECYYSMSSENTFLPRHMDERHEELKGAKGWLLPSRRSLSWLIYLSTPRNWSLEENGGALRTFPPKTSIKSGAGGNLTHDQGNLQIGWLLGDTEESTSQPVYLDSWFPLATELGQPPEPHCILYSRNQQQEQIFLTRPWLAENIQGISMADFIQSWAKRQSSDEEESGLFLRQEDAKQFLLIEDRPAWDRGENPEGTQAEDILPQRGSLVVFDSVTMPHQVELIKKGRRVALAGWMHEETQPFPEGLYS